MGISTLFGFGKKEKSEDKPAKAKTPFRVPREVTALRARIDSEYAENFPNLARYKDLERDALPAYRILDSMIVNKDHADDALRMRDDLGKKLGALGAKIKGNVGDAKDYVEKNIDYLERKSMRNNAKTLFTEFLEAYELFLSTCREGSSAHAAAVDSASTAMVKALAALNARFIKIYKQDQEVQGLREKAIEKISELGQYCVANAGALESKGLKTRAELNIKRLQNAANNLSTG
jgi:hypothetical protein